MTGAGYKVNLSVSVARWLESFHSLSDAEKSCLMNKIFSNRGPKAGASSAASATS